MFNIFVNKFLIIKKLLTTIIIYLFNWLKSAEMILMIFFLNLNKQMFDVLRLLITTLLRSTVKITITLWYNDFYSNIFRSFISVTTKNVISLENLRRHVLYSSLSLGHLTILKKQNFITTIFLIGFYGQIVITTPRN